MCGDSTSEEDVGVLTMGDKVLMIFTDPPYGINLDTDYTKMPESVIESKTYDRVLGDDTPFDPTELIGLFDDVAEQFWWGGDYYYESLPAGGSWIVWDKRNENSDGLIGSHFEMCWSRTKHRRKMIRHHWSGYNARNQDIQRTHPTEKPIPVLLEIIHDYSDVGALIVDLFLGSGTTMVAAEQLNRICYGMEIEPKYCAVTLERMSQMELKPELIK
jgi:DNA modification methylase